MVFVTEGTSYHADVKVLTQSFALFAKQDLSDDI